MALNDVQQVSCELWGWRIRIMMNHDRDEEGYEEAKD